VQVEIGPVSSQSARAWIEYATETLDMLRKTDDPRLPSPVLDAFADLLDAWRPIARKSKPFRWSSREAPERVQFLVYALYVAGLVIEREAAAGRAHLRPMAADEFHFVLVREVLAALARESEADAHFAEELRNVWGVARDKR
jgi:hypothetical protein